MATTTRPMVRIYTTAEDFTDREMNDAEFTQYEIDQAEAKTRVTESEVKATARASALAKLEALGLSKDEIATL